MSESFHYDDILAADHPREVTRASFWRLRCDYVDRTDWGLWIAPTSCHDLEIDVFPRALRQHLPVRTGPLWEGLRDLWVHWRHPLADGPDARFAPDGDDWSMNRMYFVPHVPEEPLVEIARRCEARAVVRAERGAGADVRLLSTAGQPLEPLGRDRPEHLEPLAMVESLLCASLPGEDHDPDCYLTGGKESLAIAMSTGPDEQREMHEAVRASFDSETS